VEYIVAGVLLLVFADTALATLDRIGGAIRRAWLKAEPGRRAWRVRGLQSLREKAEADQARALKRRSA